MAPTLASCDQASNKDNWDSGRLARKRQLLTKIAPRNRLIAFVVNGIATCRVLGQGLLRSYGVKTQGVDNGRGAVDLIAFGAFGAKFDLMMTDMILLILNGLKATLHIKKQVFHVLCRINMCDHLAFLSASVDVFIEKPLDPEHLVPILRELDGQ
ncbi:hypothetical protein Gotur_028136 [Gossypium turneri]